VAGVALALLGARVLLTDQARSREEEWSTRVAET
jgi:hypothetical protein